MINFLSETLNTPFSNDPTLRLSEWFGIWSFPQNFAIP